MKKILKYFTILFVVALILVIGAVGILLYANSKNVVTEEEVREYLTQDQIINNPQSGFSKLTPEEQATYLRVVNELNNLNNEFYLTGNNVSEDQFNKIFNFILKDHPEYFFVENYQYFKNPDDIIESVTVNFNADTETIKAQQEEVENWKTAILSQITPEMSSYDIAKYLHDYLVNNTDYDLNAPNDQNILSVVENGRSVCAGYSKAYQYLLNQAGIFATYVSGDSDVGPHAWNLIQIDGEYGWVDITWDDPSFVGNDQPDNFTSHQYFGVSSEELGRTHQVDQTYESFEDFPLPGFNYYVREGLYFDLNDPMGYPQFSAKLGQALSQGTPVLEVKVADMDQIDSLLTQLSYDPILTMGTINYMTDGKYPSVSFILQ